MKHIPPPTQKREKGQILVVLALTFIGLVAIIGLAIDTGYMYVSYARLRRGVDAAALGATSQYKKNATAADLEKSAREFLVLNGVPDDNLTAQVETCDSTLIALGDGVGDPALCTTPRRKLVRVTAREDVPMFFLSVLGIQTVPISVNSISEAASVDVVLVIDRSESMGELKPDGTKYSIPSTNLDPYVCNSDHPDSSSIPDGSDPSLWTGNCHPFQEVKAAALSFVNEFMDPPYDRVGIVVFDNKPSMVNFGTDASPEYMSGDADTVKQAIRNLWMYDGFHDTGSGNDLRKPDQYFEWQVDPGTGVLTKMALKGMECPYFQGGVVPEGIPPCRLTNSGGQYYYIDCAGYYQVPLDGQLCGSTNIGGGLNYASVIISNYGRQESLWVTILLTDGVPNAGYTGDTPPNPICPAYSRVRVPFCRDTDSSVRHDSSNTALYDTDDYARDQADILSDGVHSLIFAIGLGSKVTNDTTKDLGTDPAGSSLLTYIAEKGLTGGYYQADANELNKIFLAIANKIATRLTR